MFKDTFLEFLSSATGDLFDFSSNLGLSAGAPVNNYHQLTWMWHHNDYHKKVTFEGAAPRIGSPK